MRGGSQHAMAVATPVTIEADWVQTVLFDRGYLSRIRGEAIKVYLVIIEACDGLPDRSVTISLNQLDEADPAVVPDGHRQPGAARGAGAGRLDHAPARQGQDLLRPRPAAASVGRQRLGRPTECTRRIDPPGSCRRRRHADRTIALTSKRGSGRPWDPISSGSSTTCSGPTRSRRWGARRSRSTW